MSFSGDKVQQIGNEAFFMCSSLTDFALPKKVKDIGNSAFEECTSLKTVIFPSSSINLGARAFYNSGLTSISLNLDSGHGSKLFAECKQLDTASISCSSLGNEMFNGCSSLANVSLVGNIDVIPSMTFKGCSSLSSVKFSSLSSLKRIEDNAFANCTSLSSFELEKTSVEYLGNNAFNGAKMTALTLPATISSVS